MKKLIELVKIQTYQNFAFLNKKKSTNITFTSILLIFFIFLLFLSSLYNYIFYMVYQELEMVETYPFIIYIILCLVSFATTFVKSKTILFNSNDFDYLAVLPIKTSTVIASKLINIILFNLIFSFIIFIPSLVISFISLDVNIIYLFFIYLTASIIPIVISSFISFLITLVFKNSKWSNIAMIVISMSFVIFILMYQLNIENSLNLYIDMITLFEKCYPIYIVASNAVSSFLYLFLYLIINFSILFLFCLIVARFYKKINNYNFIKLSKIKVDSTDFIKTNKTITLLKIELNRLLSNPGYFLNVSIGAIMSIIFVIAISIYSSSLLFEYKSIVIDYYPLIISFFVGLIPTTAVCISLEGKFFPTLKTLPITLNELFKGKILFNILLNLPIALISLLLMVFTVGMNFINILISFIVILGTIVATSLIGLIANLYFPKLEFSSVTQVVKNSAAVLVTVSVDILIFVFFCIIYFIMLKYTNNTLVCFVSFIYYGILIIIALKILNKKKNKLFSNIIC